MPTDIFQIPNVAAQRRQYARERLEYAMDMVDRGEVAAVAVAMVTTKGSAVGLFSEAENGIMLLGSVRLLEHKIAEALMENDRDIGALDA
jgi:hypothetical protein